MEYLKKKITHKKISYGKDLATFIIFKVVKGLMRKGKFQKFHNILIKGAKHASLLLFQTYKIRMKPINIVLKAIRTLGPFCDLRGLKASGRRVLVPAPFRAQKKVTVAVRFLIHGIFKRKKLTKYLYEAVADELFFLWLEDDHANKTQSEAFQVKSKYLKDIFYNEKNLRFLRNL